MPYCILCNQRPAMQGNNLCKECWERRHGSEGGPGFQEFFEKYIKPKSDIEGLLVADDALLQYEYYKMDPRFTPYIGGGLLYYRDEHKPLEDYFLRTFFSIFRERIYSLDGNQFIDTHLEALKNDFYFFYRSLNPSLHGDDQLIKDSGAFYAGNSQTYQVQSILKKGMIRRGIDPSPVDIASKEFASGSALFYLELYVLLKDNETLKKFQEGLTKDSLKYRDILREPVVLLMPWEHQKNAFSAWEKGGKQGILEMATATGKTLIGIMAIEALYRVKPDGVVRIFAHSTNILNQWRREVIEKLGIIANLSSPYTIPININGFTIYFNTLQTVYKNPTLYPADLMIADEVHHLAAFEYRKALTIPCKWKLGLSATVEGEQRQRILTAELGKILYQFSLNDALEKGIVPSFRWIICPSYLSIKEDEEFSRITESIRKLFLVVRQDVATLKKITRGEMITLEDLGDFVKAIEIARYSKIDLPQEWKNLMGLILNRRWIIHRSYPRLQEAIKLARETAKNHKVILFAMDIESCDLIADSLKKDVKNLYVVHSKVKTDVFSQIQSFRQGENGVLIGARMLDEGIDIPDASIGINVASSKTRLQLIQRLGRVLRKQKGKESPIFFHYVALPQKKDLIDSEDTLQFLDDLAWIQDAAMKMGLDTEVVYTDEILQKMASDAESAISRKYSRAKEKDSSKIGTLNVGYIRNQFSPDAIQRIIGILLKLDENHQITDKEWTSIVKTAHLKKQKSTFQLPGYWWLLILAERNPRKLISLLDPEFNFSDISEVDFIMERISVNKCPDIEPVRILSLESFVNSNSQQSSESDEIFATTEKEKRIDEVTISQPRPLELEITEDGVFTEESKSPSILLEPDQYGVSQEEMIQESSEEVVESPLIQPESFISETDEEIPIPKDTKSPSIPSESEQRVESPVEAIPETIEEIISAVRTRVSDLFDNKQYSDALRICDRFLEKYPDDIRMINVKAGCEYSLGDYKNAEKTVQRAIILDPLKPVLWENLGRIYSKLGHHEKAQKCRNHANNVRSGTI